MNQPTPINAQTPESQTAELDADLGGTTVQLKARMTPVGLLAVGGLVSSVLLSVAACMGRHVQATPTPHRIGSHETLNGAPREPV